MTDTVHFRPGTPDDAMHLARLIDIAGYGVPRHFWETAKAPGQDVWDFGASRACRENGSFSYTNATIAQAGDRVAGCLVVYEIAALASQADYADMPAMFVPIQKLEDLATGSAYISVLAVYPEFRGCGIGAALAGTVDTRPGQEQTLIAADANHGAIRLYRRLGFEVAAREPMVKDGWTGDGANWLLMRKPGQRARANA